MTVVAMLTNPCVKGIRRERSTSEEEALEQVDLPEELPEPDMAILSDPVLNLAAHLRYHGRQGDLNGIELSRITAPHVLRLLLASVPRGGEQLLRETHRLLRDREPEVRNQLQASTLPPYFRLHLKDDYYDSIIAKPSITHLLAIASPSKRDRGVILPIHAYTYILQCGALPPLRPARSGPGFVDLPIIPLVVSRPQLFYLTHAFLYMRNAKALFQSLMEQDATEANLDPAQDALHRCAVIHAAWANGLAIGLLDDDYWDTLKQAWSVAISIIRPKARRRSLPSN